MIKDIEIYAVSEKEVIGIAYEEGIDVIKLPPLADGWHYEIEEEIK